MHTLINLLLFIMGLLVVVGGGYALYWNLTVRHFLSSRLLKDRVAWTAALIFFLIVFLGVWGMATSSHVIMPGQALASSVWFMLRNIMLALSFAAGYYTLKVAGRYDFTRKQRAIPERLVWALSPTVWPWLIFSFVSSFLNIILRDPLLTTLTQLVLPLAALFFFWPVIVASMISATRWVADSPLRQNMKWYAYLIVSIALTVWVGYVVVNILGLREVLELRALSAIIANIFFPAVIYTAYKSSKSLVMTHKLPPIAV